MSSLINTRKILLADDDKDDQILFQEVLDELPLVTHLSTVLNGEQLMLLLHETKELPDILFLDLNMPRKNGFACLSEVKRTEKLKGLPVVVFSTSYDANVVDILYKNGAQFYIRKPNNFVVLKNIIHKALLLTEPGDISQSAKEQFVLSRQFSDDEKK